MRLGLRGFFAIATCLAAAAACDEDGAARRGGSGGDGGASNGSGASTNSTGTGMGGAPPCTAETLADSIRVTAVAIAGASSPRAVTAQAGVGSVVAWVGSGGMVHVTPLDAIDARSGDDLTIEGTQIFGVAATDTDVALLVARAPDYMTFVRIDLSGGVLATVNLVGGGDHDVQGTEWFGEFATTGRLVATGDGTYAAYHALHRHWPDGIGHQGDTLRLLDANGAPLGTGGWDWGCSHSVDQRLSYSISPGLVPICISDCYPDKGIFFNHDAKQITPDPQANCAGGYSTQLGGLVATGSYAGVVAPGFFLVYQDAQGDSYLHRFDQAGDSVMQRALDAPGSSRLAQYGEGLLLGYDQGGTTYVRPLDDSGNDAGQPEVVSAPLPELDVEGRTDGSAFQRREVAWANASGTTLTVVRVRWCP